ncbi:sigma-54-dependent transcriptional regulator [Acidobacteriota bacterium]
MIEFNICVVDDDEYIREGISDALEAIYHVDVYPTAEDALKAIKKKSPDLVLLDIGLPGMSGIEALRDIKKINPEILVIMITAYEDIDTVISAMKLGAHDYILKPLHMDALEKTIENALDTVRLRKEVQILQERYLKENTPCFIAESNAIQDVMEFMTKVAKSPDTPILIIGETGTGKELIASAIHFHSPNFKGPFVTVNCAAIPRELIESELFGYEKGAFTGARASGKKGLIEEAANGTLFLDEVGDLSLESQAKLLRFLEVGEFYRVGGTKKLYVQTRVVSATNKDIDAMIKKGQFRNDLFFRLGVIRVQIPPLYERPGDIILLAKHFLIEFSRKFGKKFTSISPEAETALKKYNWIGNVRELKNIVERGVLVGDGPELMLQDLGIMYKSEGERIMGQEEDEPAFPPLSSEGIDLTAAHKSLEKFYIEAALKLADGNESKAARLLNMNHHTFRYRKKKLLGD